MCTILQGDEYRNERRVFWPSGDPALISKGFFCIAVILAYARILNMFQISQVHHSILVMFSDEKKIIMKCDINFNSTTFISQYVYVIFLQIIGPIQISLSQMIYDVLQMLFIFLVFLMAFAMGLTRLYYFYNGMTRNENGELQQQPTNFVR